MFRRSVTVVVLALLGCLAGCAGMRGSGPTASAMLEARSGSTVSGTASFQQVLDRVRVHVELTGLVPGSEHGFHVHEKGDCSASDASSAGPHFNPAGVAHGRAGGEVHHAGDLPSLVADANGNVRVDLELSGVTLDAAPGSIVGRALIVHRDRDDFTSQPAGNAGPRFACGVIRPQ
jgi:Cu-Zn family superoxide dismutase